MPEEFHENNPSGGWTFLNLCNDKNGNQWGEHRNMEELVCLSIALNMGKYLMPKVLWGSLPGGMPYISFNTEKQ